MRPNLQQTADLVKFTGEILNGKLHFLCSVFSILTRLNVLMFVQIPRLRISQWSLTTFMQQVNDEWWKITGTQLTFVYLVKLLSNHWATLSPENYENISNFKDWGLTLVVYKRKVYCKKIRSITSSRPEVFCKEVFSKIRKIHRKTSVTESLF